MTDMRLSPTEQIEAMRAPLAQEGGARRRRPHPQAVSARAAARSRGDRRRPGIGQVPARRAAAGQGALDSRPAESERVVSKLAVIDAEGEVVSEASSAIDGHSTPARAEPVRVIEVIAVDYIWNEQACGFFPVFGAPHAGSAARVNRETLARELAAITPKPRALKP